MRSERIEERCGQRRIPAITLAGRVLLIEDGGMPLALPVNRARLLARIWGASCAMQACGHINAAADFGPCPQGERILRELVCGTRPCGANATDPLIDRATA